jgi:hypothetical protein
LSSLVKELLRRVDEAVLKHYSGYSTSSYRVGRYTFIKVDVFEVWEDRPVDIEGTALILLKRDKRGERVLTYTVKIPGNRQLEYELRKQLKALKREYKKRVMTEGLQSSDERHPS